MSPRGIHLVAASDEAAGSEWSQTLARGLVRPTSLFWACAPGYHRSISQPTLGRSELPAALGSEFARGTLGCGPVTEQIAGRREVASGLRWAV